MNKIRPLMATLALACGATWAQPILQTAPTEASKPPTSLAAPAAAPSIRETPAATGTPPPSRLGQEVNAGVPVAMPSGAPPAGSPRVVFPSPDAVVERAVREIEDMQLTPAQMDRLKQIYLERSQSRASPYVTPAKPVTRTLMVNLDPGVSPPVLRLTRGQQTSIVFSDVSGQPWFIDKVSLNRQLFSDGRIAQAAAAAPSGAAGGQAGAEAPTNVLTVEPLTPAAYGNVTVTLRGQSTPVIFVLTSAQEEVDMRVDAKVPGHNPDARREVTLQSTPTLDNALPYFLDGVPPQGAKRMKVTGLDGAEAWVFDKNLYVKARANAQYPAYLSAARSTNGISVYRYHGVPRAATFTTGGRVLTAFFE